MVEVKMSSTAYYHLKDVSPGGLSDDQYHMWGYEVGFCPLGDEEKFTRECAEAINAGPVASRRVGKHGRTLTIRFPSEAHALACAHKLYAVGGDFADGSGGFDAETRAEGRNLFNAALSIRKQLGVDPHETGKRF